jgi:hypothetical protein
LVIRNGDEVFGAPFSGNRCSFNGIIKKPDNYAFACPDFLYFMRTGGGNMDQAFYIDQVLFQMYMKHKMRQTRYLQDLGCTPKQSVLILNYYETIYY